MVSTALTGLGVRAAASLTRLRSERGQTFTEYAIIIGAITLGILLGVQTLRDAIITALSNAAGNI